MVLVLNGNFCITQHTTSKTVHTNFRDRYIRLCIFNRNIKYKHIIYGYVQTYSSTKIAAQTAAVVEMLVLGYLCFRRFNTCRENERRYKSQTFTAQKHTFYTVYMHWSWLHSVCLYEWRRTM